MPVPWLVNRHGQPKMVCEERDKLDASGHPCRFETHERGITLRQLRDIRSLLERTCKARMFLCGPGVCSTIEIEKNAVPISWPTINQHHIRYRLLMRVIKQESSCSWVEFVAERPQKPKFFVSHNWNEYFREFMNSIDLHSRHLGIRDLEAYWICVFALNQWRIDLSSEVISGPFIESLRSCSSAVLMLDQEASSLRRLWCLIEVYILLIKHEEKLGWEAPRLQILTPMGPLGSHAVKSAPVIEALKGVDTKMATATRKEDERQILNFLAGIPESTGLKTNSEGVLLSPKMLDLDPKFKDHEKTLMQTKSAKFRDFDEAIKHWATKLQRADDVLHTSERRVVGETDLRNNPHRRGMTLAQLRRMWMKLRKACVSWKRVGRKSNKDDAGKENPGEAECDVSQITVYDFFFEVLAREPCYTGDETTEKSYMETLPYGERVFQDADYFITVPHSMPFAELMNAIEWHAEGRRLYDSTVYWAWFCSLSRADVVRQFKQQKSPTDLLLDKCTTLQGFLYVVDSRMSSLERMNPVYELWKWLVKRNIEGTSFDICSGQGVLSTSRPFHHGSYQFGNFPLDAVRALVNFDVGKLAETWDKESRERFYEDVEAHTAELKRHPSKLSAGRKSDAHTADHMTGKEIFNSRVRRLGCGPALRELASSNRPTAVNDIIKITRATRTNMLSPELAGVHGETPLMLASAKGNLRIMETLLRLKASVSEKDMDGETPLHYAALAGQTRAAVLLLQHGALLDLKSSFEETPLRVVHTSPASFLGVNVEEIKEFLTEAAEWNEWNARNAEELHSSWVDGESIDLTCSGPAPRITFSAYSRRRTLSLKNAASKESAASASVQVALDTLAGDLESFRACKMESASDDEDEEDEQINVHEDAFVKDPKHGSSEARATPSTIRHAHFAQTFEEKRFGDDGVAYTFSDFISWFGEHDGLAFWEVAGKSEALEKVVDA